MSVKHGAGPPFFYYPDMQDTFIGRFLVPAANHMRMFINQQNLLRKQGAFVDSAGANSQMQRLAIDNSTQISARTESPATGVKAARGGCKTGSDLCETRSHGSVFEDQVIDQPMVVRTMTNQRH